MPMVPETFAPSVTQDATPMTPATGPWVSPMKNAAPSLLLQTGQTLEQAGNAEARLGNTIGDRVQETMDAALTKSAETQFLKGAQDVLYSPQSGYLNTRGLDAQTQWNTASQAIAKARQDARTTLANPVQQRAYDLATTDHMLMMGRTMADHQHQQVTQYGIQQGQDRADSMNILAKSAYLQGRMDDYQRYAGQGMDEVLHVAALNGAAPDSDIAKAMLRTKRTDLVHGITIGLLDDHKYDQAKQFFEDEQQNIDMRTSEVLGNAVKTEYDRNLTETKGDAFLAAAAMTHADPNMAVSNPRGLVERGNLPIWNRPTVNNADGTVSSEYSTSFQDDQGREVLVPTVVNGKFLTPDGAKPAEGSAAEKSMFHAAWDHYLKTGENLGKFDNPDDADAYAAQLHSRGTSTLPQAPYTYGPLATGATINPMRITDVPGSARPDGRTHDGYDIAMPPGTGVTAPLDGKVVKVWNDEKFGGGLSMRVQLTDGNTLGIAHLSAANLNEGDQVNRGQVLGLSGKTGNATGPVLHVALEDPDGKHIDYFGASKAQPDHTGLADPNVLQHAIDAAKGDSSLDPFQQKRVILYMESQHTHERAIQEQQYQDVKQQAVDYYFNHNQSIDGLPAAVKTQLRPEDIFHMSQPKEQRSDFSTLYWFATHPDYTERDVLDRFPSLNQSDVLSLTKSATDHGGDEAYIKDASVNKMQLENSLYQAGLGNLVNMQGQSEATKRGNEQRYVGIYNDLQTMFSDKAQALKRKPTLEERQQMTNDYLMRNQVNVLEPHWYGDKDVSSSYAAVPVAELPNAWVDVGGQKVELSQIPQPKVDAIRKMLIQKGQPATWQNIAWWWVQGGR